MTTEQKKLSQRYLLYRMLTNMWFVGAVWLFFYRLFINDQQVGFLDGMAFAIGLVAEVPSGALADKWGRDRIVRFGWLFAGAGILIQALGGSFSPLFIGQAILMIGVAFVSGADEALFFDKLAFKRDSLNWRKLVTRGSQFALTGSLVATVAGGLLHNVDVRIPWILTSAMFILSTIFIWPVKDTRPKSEKQKILTEIKDYLLGIKSGFSQFHSSKLRLYIPLIIAVQGLFYTTGWGLLRLVLLDRFGFKPFRGSIIVAISCLTAVAVLSVIHKYAESISERFILTLISLLAAASLLLSLRKIGLWGGLVILILYVGEHVLYPFMSEILNKHAPEEQRETVLSVASFMRMIPYVALAPIIGYLNTHNQLGYFLISWSALIILSIFLYLAINKRDVRIRLEQNPVLADT